MRKSVLFAILILSLCFYVSAEENIAPTSFFPPIIGEIAIEPQNPVVGQDTKVSVALDLPETVDSEVIQAWLYYSSDDGNTWNTIEMEQSESDKKIWFGYIPVQNQETQVLYYVRCVDDSGNVSSQLSPKIKLIDKKNGKEPDWLPNESSFTLIYADQNDDKIEVPDNFDILSVSVGVDESFMYFKIATEGDIPTQPSSGGQQIPYYNMMISNVDEKDTYDKLSGDNYIYYSTAALQYIMQLPVCAMGAYDARGMITSAEWKPLDYFVDKNQLLLKIPRKEIKNDPKKRIKIFVASGFQNDMPNFHKIKYVDAVGFAYIYPGAHSFAVKNK